MNLDFDPQKNYYDILGVAEDANDDDIKKAYRKLAMKYHPDRNSWNAAAEEKFKEINEANEVLSNQQKRSQYDAFRKGWGGFWWFDFWWWGFGGGWFGGWTVDFGDLGDVIGSFFGGWFGGVWWRRAGPQRGEDLELQRNISFEDAYHGLQKEITYGRAMPAEWITSKSCTACEGRWVVMQAARTMFGVMQTQTVCSSCGGAGQERYKDGKKVHNGGLEKQDQELTVKVPAGIKSGSKIKYPGMWNYGQNGGGAGDLYVKIVIKSHDLRRRDENNLLIDKEITIFDAVLGGSMEVEHPDGMVTVKIPKWLQVGEYIRVNGKWFGDKNMIGHRKWDMIVMPKIKIPKKLSSKEEKLWKELQNME